MTTTSESTTIQITLPTSAPTDVLERVQAMARDLAGNAGIVVEVTEIRSCQICGCTDAQGCMFGCSWVSDSQDLCTACAPTAAPTPTYVDSPLMQLTKYAHGSLTGPGRDEDFYLNLQECIEDNSTFYISVDELRNALTALRPQSAGLSENDPYLILQEQLERASSFHIPVDELKASINSLQRRGWAVLAPPRTDPVATPAPKNGSSQP